MAQANKPYLNPPKHRAYYLVCRAFRCKIRPTSAARRCCAALVGISPIGQIVPKLEGWKANLVPMVSVGTQRERSGVPETELASTR